jgi:hypothetical protein
MNCQEWEERVASGDPEAAEHLRDCPSCAALADGLARDARLLQTLPPEAFAVDYAAIRAAARKGAVQRSRRPKILAVLAVAAAVLLTVKLPLHRQPPAPVAKVSMPPPAVEVARTAPAVSSTVTKVQPRRRNPRADLDRRFADFLRTQYELRHPAPLRAREIATGNPNVTILLLQESKGDANE